MALMPTGTMVFNGDLTDVLNRVARTNAAWTPERLKAAEQGYREFLGALKLTPKMEVTSKDVDEVWHNHILHTHQYARDCNAFFGRFMHHVPHTGKAHMATTRAACGGSDGCTGCGSGCSGGGTIKAAAECTNCDGIADGMTGTEAMGMGKPLCAAGGE
jgi:hypothetical protein